MQWTHSVYFSSVKKSTLNYREAIIVNNKKRSFFVHSRNPWRWKKNGEVQHLKTLWNRTVTPQKTSPSPTTHWGSGHAMPVQDNPFMDKNTLYKESRLTVCCTQTKHTGLKLGQSIYVTITWRDLIDLDYCCLALLMFIYLSSRKHNRITDYRRVGLHYQLHVISWRGVFLSGYWWHWPSVKNEKLNETRQKSFKLRPDSTGVWRLLHWSAAARRLVHTDAAAANVTTSWGGCHLFLLSSPKNEEL